MRFKFFDQVDDENQLFVGLTENGSSTADFTRHQISLADSSFIDGKEAASDKPTLSDEIRCRMSGIARNIVNPRLDGLSRDEQIQVCAAFIETMVKNMSMKDSLMDFTNECASNLLANFNGIEAARVDLNRRLTQVVELIDEIKSKIAHSEKVYDHLDARIRNLERHICAKAFSSLNEERKVAEQLEEMNAKLAEYKTEIDKVNTKLFAYRSKILGIPEQSFQASASARIFMLSKNDHEIQQMKNYVQKMLVEIAQLNRENDGDE